MKKKMPEKALEKRIILTLKMLGFYTYKTSSSGGCYDYNINFNQAGIADLIVIGNNKVAFLEVKTEKGRQSKEQKEFQELCDKHGVKYSVVRSTGEAVRAMEE